MTTLIRNIGSLDARNASQETLEQITKIKNVGSIIVSKENRPFIMKIDMENIGSTVEMDKDVKLHVGPFEFTKELLESAPQPVKMSIVGPVAFDREITAQLLEEKLAWLNIIGPVEVFEHISGVMMSKMHDSVGPIDIINPNEIVLKGNNKIDNYFLKSLEDDSVIKCSGVLELDEGINLKEFEKKIKKIVIGSKLSIYDDQKDPIMKKIYENTDESYTEVNIGVKPALMKFDRRQTQKLVILKRNCHYLQDGSKLDAFNLKSIKKSEISSNGIMILADDITNDLLDEKNIIFSSTKRIYFPVSISETMLKFLAEGTQGVPYDPAKTNFVNGEQKITASRMKIIKDNSTCIIFGSLSLNDDICLEDIDQKFAVVDNYGSIESSEDICSVLQDKMRYSEGSVEARLSGDSAEDDEDLSKYDNVIQNAGSYKL